MSCRRLMSRPSSLSVALLSSLACVGMALAATAQADSLALPAQSRIDVTTIDGIALDGAQNQLHDVMLTPASDASGRTDLPHYCVLVGDAKRDGDRLRITTQALTCVETEGGDSHIYSGELVAGAYDADGQFGLDACDDNGCELEANHVFQLELTHALDIEQMPNPSAELNAERRRAGPRTEADGEAEGNNETGD